MSNKHIFGEKSGSIEHCDYFDKTNTLEIKFSNGGTYHYPDCHKSHYDELVKADSPGGYFHSRLRNKFTGVKQ